MTTILHLVSIDYYNSIPSNEPYLPREFEQDGFIHCTQGEEMLRQVANTFYKSTHGEYVVLVIDEQQVNSTVKYEPAVPVDGEEVDVSDQLLFPHIYGALNREAIEAVVAAHRGDDGTFIGFEHSLDE